MASERTGRLGIAPIRSKARGALGAAAAPGWLEAWRAVWWSRLAVWGAGVLGLLWLGRAPNTTVFDPARLTEPGPPLVNLLLAPAARWDSVWYLDIARSGYSNSDHNAKAAFYPLYPGLMRALGWIVGSQLVAGIVISLACFLVALVLLRRLAALDIGEDGARGAVLLVAFFPTAFFFSAVYAESLFLLLSVAAVLAARRGRWAVAGAIGGLAALTRNSGVLLLVPLLLLYLYGPRADAPEAAEAAAGGPPRPAAAGGRGHRPIGRADWRRLVPRHRPGPSILWLALVPLGLGAYMAYCAQELGDALAPFHAQKLWMRHFVPLGALTQGWQAARHGLQALADGAGTTTPHSSAAALTAGQDLMLLVVAAAAIVALVGVLRRLPFAYGAYAAVVLAFTLSYPVPNQPLMSLPRYLVVLFPFQMWAAGWAVRRGALERTVGISAVFLGLFTAYFARWGFVA